MEIKGKVAIVTGASGGIGLATAKLLAEEGAKVALIARNEEKLSALVREIPESMFVVCDMTKEKEVKEMIAEVYEHYGRIDILVNNAGQGYDAGIEKIDIPTLRKIYDLDVIGPLVAIQEVIPIMRKVGGSIINVSSGTALMNLPDAAGYSSAKRALAQISTTAAVELKKDKISVGVIFPYVTATDFERNTIRGGNLQFDADWIKNLPHPPDTPETAAEKIIEGIKSGESIIYVHDWMMKNI